MKSGIRKIIIRTLFAVILVSLLSIRMLAQDGVVTGDVVDETGQPIWRATVTLVAAEANHQKTTTNRNGRFEFKQVGSGRCLITVVATGFYKEDDSTEFSVSARAGDKLTIRLNKGAVITGRITNQSGEPLVGLQVRAFRVKDEKYRVVQDKERRESVSDDRGIYRIFGLRPGVYMVSAEDNKLGFYLPSPYRFNMTNWHPSGVRETAMEVQVTRSGITANVDILYQIRQGQVVSGIVTLKSGISSNAFTSVNLFDARSGVLLNSTLTTGQQKGFAIYGVANGEYDVEAESAGQNGQSRLISPRRRVKVSGNDVGGLELPLAPLGLIKGKIQAAAVTQNSCGKAFSLNEISVKAIKDDSEQQPDLRFTQVEEFPDSQGVFTLPNLSSGQYRLDLNGLASFWYVKQFIGISDDSGLVPVRTENKGSEITIVISPAGATLAGKAERKSQIYLLPINQSGRLKVTEIQMANTQSDGSFFLGNLAPGSYRVFSRVKNNGLKNISANGLLGLRREAESKGTIVELKPCQKLTGLRVS